MKIALIKLGSRISISNVGTSGGTGETLSIIKMLVDGGAKVDAYTKVLDKDGRPDTFDIYNIEDTYQNIKKDNYDCLVILNGNVNYFGGQDDPAQTLNYKVINKFDGPVYYIMCDANLFLKQIWQSISGKKWASNYNREDIEITRDDIVYIAQPKLTSEVLKKARKFVNIKKVIHYPFEKFPLLTLSELQFNEMPKYDLLYGGTFRNGRREDDMVKFYFGYPDGYAVEMFGNIDINNFNEKKVAELKPPMFGKAVKYDEFPNKMLESKATVIIGDKLYKEVDDLAQRIYESIMIGNVTLIDASYDYTKRVFKNPELRRFNYVYSRRDVEDRLDKLDDIEFRKHIVDLQREDVKIDCIEYCRQFVNILEGENI